MEPTPSIFATLAELKDFLAQRPAAVHLGAGISIALSGQSVSARDFHRAGLELARKNGLIDAKQLSRLQETLA
ncbi:MAG: hypothetical protein JNL97_00495, partial [Verrucomicrobiales bacterium]|nr:hypothetical protein [Verrucomicrobiales bacterium]